MRPKRVEATALIAIAACSGAYVARTWHVPKPILIRCDLDGNGEAERIVLDTTRDPSLAVWHGDACLWQGVPGRWKPWKLMTADVDGDANREIIVGVHKSTRFFPRPHNCLFVYGWDGKRAFPKWLGSSLSKPFTDFTFANLDSDRAEELVSVEMLRDGKRCVVVYSWSGFGFVADRQQGAWEQVDLVKAEPGKVTMRVAGKRLILRRQTT